MSAQTVLEEIHEKIARLTPAERQQLRARLDEPIDEENSLDGEGEEITEEELRESLKSFEEYYGMSSEKFVRRYDARDPAVLRFDQAGGWRSFYDWWEQTRDETSHCPRLD
jgi:hypothetical protein